MPRRYSTGEGGTRRAALPSPALVRPPSVQAVQRPLRDRENDDGFPLPRAQGFLLTRGVGRLFLRTPEKIVAPEGARLLPPSGLAHEDARNLGFHTHEIVAVTPDMTLVAHGERPPEEQQRVIVRRL